MAKASLSWGQLQALSGNLEKRCKISRDLETRFAIPVCKHEQSQIMLEIGMLNYAHDTESSWVEEIWFHAEDSSSLCLCPCVVPIRKPHPGVLTLHSGT